MDGWLGVLCEATELMSVELAELDRTRKVWDGLLDGLQVRHVTARHVQDRRTAADWSISELLKGQTLQVRVPLVTSLAVGSHTGGGWGGIGMGVRGLLLALSGWGNPADAPHHQLFCAPATQTACPGFDFGRILFVGIEFKFQGCARWYQKNSSFFIGHSG